MDSVEEVRITSVDPQKLDAFLEMSRVLGESAAGSPHDWKPAVAGSGRESNRIHNQRVPFPAGDGVSVARGSVILALHDGMVTPVQIDKPRAFRFGAYEDFLASLHDVERTGRRHQHWEILGRGWDISRGAILSRGRPIDDIACALACQTFLPVLLDFRQYRRRPC